MSIKGNLLERIEKLARPVIDSEGMELVDLEFKREGKNWYLRLFIDKPGGINLDDCQNISHQVAELFDIEEVITHRYILEVSSPGLTRSLKRAEDYQRFAGRLIKLTTLTPIKGRRKFIGQLKGLDGETVKLEMNNGETIFIPLSAITKAHLEVEC